MLIIFVIFVMFIIFVICEKLLTFWELSIKYLFRGEAPVSVVPQVL